MLNAKFFGAGMNLQMTTDIIMYHRFTDEMEEQIVGRAQRLGRDINSTLNVYYLVHDNEKQTFENNFCFKDKIIGINDLVDDIKSKQKTNILLDDSEDGSDEELEESEKSDEELEELKDLNKTKRVINLNKNNIIKKSLKKINNNSDSEDNEDSDMENINMD